MSYQDLLVVLEAHPHARELLLVPSGLAERFGAHLVGTHMTRISCGRRKRGWLWS
jgi:hypothetical protein